MIEIPLAPAPPKPPHELEPGEPKQPGMLGPKLPASPHEEAIKPKPEIPPKAPPKPPHERKGKLWKRLILSVVIGTVVTIIFALILNFFQISIYVVLFACAQIWIATSTIVFVALAEK